MINDYGCIFRRINAVKTSFQLSIDTDMKQRLLNFSNQTGIPVSRLIRDMLQKYLSEEERKFNIQLPLEKTVVAVNKREMIKIKKT